MSAIETKPAQEELAEAIIEEEFEFNFGEPEVKEKKGLVVLDYGNDIFMDNAPDEVKEAINITFDYIAQFDEAFITNAEKDIVQYLNENEDIDRISARGGWGPARKAGKGARTKHGEITMAGVRSRTTGAPGEKDKSKMKTSPYFTVTHKSPYYATSDRMKEMNASMMQKINKV